MAAKEKKGLGTGLGILFGEEEYNDENELRQLSVTKLVPRREQPRTVFDDASLQELADSLRRYGVIQPVTARKLDGGFYQIIAGERRWRAARLAGLEEIPVRVIEADDRRTAELALVENLQREDLNPIEEARGYQALIEEYGLTQEEAAQSVGRSRPAITNSMRLLSLAPAVLSMVEEGKLSAGHARALLPIADEREQKAAADEVVEKGLSVRRTEQLAARRSKPEAAPVKSVGNSTTTPRDLVNDEDVRLVLYLLAESVSERLRKNQLEGQVVSIYVRDTDLCGYHQQKKLAAPTNISGEIAGAAFSIFPQLYRWEKPIRSIGVSVCDLKQEGQPRQLSLFLDEQHREQQMRADRMVSLIRSRYGYAAVQRGIMHEDRYLSSLNATAEDHMIHPHSYLEHGNRSGCETLLLTRKVR